MAKSKAYKTDMPLEEAYEKLSSGNWGDPDRFNVLEHSANEKGFVVTIEYRAPLTHTANFQKTTILSDPVTIDIIGTRKPRSKATTVFLSTTSGCVKNPYTGERTVIDNYLKAIIEYVIPPVIATDSTKRREARNSEWADLITKVIVVAIGVVLFLALNSCVEGCSSGSSSNWDSKSEQEKANARYANEVGNWADSNGY